MNPYLVIYLLLAWICYLVFVISKWPLSPEMDAGADEFAVDCLLMIVLALIWPLSIPYYLKSTPDPTPEESFSPSIRGGEASASGTDNRRNSDIRAVDDQGDHSASTPDSKLDTAGKPQAAPPIAPD
jgi:hypothetical protein